MSANTVIAVVDTFIYVVLSKAEKPVLYGELIVTTECITLYPRCRTNRGRYNVVQLYFLIVIVVDINITEVRIATFLVWTSNFAR
jgi:hypothetical protein